MRTQILTCLVLVSTSSALSQNNPSFDCSKAKMLDEKLICTDASLMTLDRELSLVYSSRIKEVPGLKKDQVTWIRSRRKWCETETVSVGDAEKVACLKFEYLRRIELLKRSDQLAEVPEDKSVAEGPVGTLTFRQSFTSRRGLFELHSVDVFLPKQTVPQQTIKGSCSPDPKDPSCIGFEDFNFDGYPDLTIWNSEASGATNSYSDVYLFDPKKREFRREPSFPEGVFPEIDKEKKLLRTHYNGGHAGAIGGYALYRYINGSYRTVFSEDRQWVPEYCAKRDRCDEKDAFSRNPGCQLLPMCEQNRSAFPHCEQYISKRNTFNEHGVLVKSEEVVGDSGDPKTACQLIR
jgi:uncharacterized protein